MGRIVIVALCVAQWVSTPGVALINSWNVQGSVLPAVRRNALQMRRSGVIKPLWRMQAEDDGAVFIDGESINAVSARSLLVEAAKSKEVDVEAVLAAMMYLRTHSSYHFPGPSSLQGRWRLVASTGNPAEGIPRGYFPKWLKATQAFDTSKCRLINGLHVGPFQCQFSGPYQWDSVKLSMRFALDRMKILLFSFPWRRNRHKQHKQIQEDLAEEELPSLEESREGDEGALAEIDVEGNDPSGGLRFLFVSEEAGVYAWHGFSVEGSTLFSLYKRDFQFRDKLKALIYRILPFYK